MTDRNNHHFATLIKSWMQAMLKLCEMLLGKVYKGGIKLKAYKPTPQSLKVGQTDIICLRTLYNRKYTVPPVKHSCLKYELESNDASKSSHQL